eukprot:TRINITY_DN2313_c0_g1_i1.p1 TRINITY_DN2313_c0_g1~~TRINITY_DN2313_c0_g1_i1.p1  ORF type:complete len:392 (+),score=65.45 TRINITY_DN2313_c0_g1_i1:172-1347(+)
MCIRDSINAEYGERPNEMMDSILPKGSMLHCRGAAMKPEPWGSAPSILQSVSLSNYTVELQKELEELRGEMHARESLHQESVRKLQAQLDGYRGQEDAGGEACGSGQHDGPVGMRQESRNRTGGDVEHITLAPVRGTGDGQVLDQASPCGGAPAARSLSEGSEPSLASIADLRSQIKHLETEKTELAEELNTQLIEAQLQIQQLRARYHMQEEKLRDRHSEKETMSLEIERVCRCVDSSHSAINAALARVTEELGREGTSGWGTSLQKQLEHSHKQLEKQGTQLESLKRKLEEASGSSTEGSPSGVGSSAGSRRGMTRRSRSRESDAQVMSNLLWEGDRSDSWDLGLKGETSTQGRPSNGHGVSPRRTHPQTPPVTQHLEPEEECQGCAVM